jgi:acetaldehyde dehydrogenase (acetylating)
MSEDKDLVSQQEARDAVEAAHLAFLQIARFDQAKIDRICAAMASVALAESARLGQMAHEETGFGRADDKREKNRFAAEDVGIISKLKTVGVVRETESIVRNRSPRGVVAAIIPSTIRLRRRFSKLLSQ